MSCRVAVAMEKAQKLVSNGTLLDFEEKVRSRRHKAVLVVGDAKAAVTRAKEELEIVKMAPNMADTALATSERRNHSLKPMGTNDQNGSSTWPPHKSSSNISACTVRLSSKFV